MIILGVDPGIARTGWGIIECQMSNVKCQMFGCVETSTKRKHEDRLETIYDSIQKIIKEHKPDSLAIEELFFNTNAKTALIVGQARGVVLLCGAQNKIPVSIYTPLQVKVAVTGYGRAEKRQVGQMVKTLLSLKSIPKPDDVTDALAIAITHAFSAKTSAFSKK
ncbi:MAG: crossover junction endodeoxyribonuclease RuvC [Patescibacteria group bacterium]|nr:crossover junction endodeoxyribonuclease RuvC [Patescibacteria group bacterium]